MPWGASVEFLTVTAKKVIGFIDAHQAPIELNMLWNVKWNATFMMQVDMKRVDDSPIYKK